jgi:hypothetical protein
MAQIGEDVGQVPLDQVGHISDRPESTMRGARAPAADERWAVLGARYVQKRSNCSLRSRARGTRKSCWSRVRNVTSWSGLMCRGFMSHRYLEPVNRLSPARWSAGAHACGPDPRHRADA